MIDALPHVSATEPDWTRERRRRGEWNPGKALLASIRTYQSASNPLSRRWAVLCHRFWSAVSGADIPVNTQIGGGLLIPHPNGIVVHPDCRIGVNCLILQQVTIGMAHGGVPVVGGHVDIGAGARLIGPIAVGDHVRIGANAVVLGDVPTGATAVGIPARVAGSPSDGPAPTA